MDLLIHPASHGIARSNTENVLTTVIPAFGMMLLIFALPDLWPVLTQTPSFIFNLCFLAIVLCLVGSLLRWRYRYHCAAAAALFFLLSFAAWHVGVLGSMTPEARPWNWGYAGAGLGMASMAWQLKPALIYGTVFSILLTVVPALPGGSIRSWDQSWQDGLLTLAMSIVIAAPIQALRLASSAADDSAASSLVSFAELKRTEELSTQRASLDALTHDTILSTLIVAAQASDEEIMAAARQAAGEALGRLDAFRLDPSVLPGSELPLGQLIHKLQLATASHQISLTAPTIQHDDAAGLPVVTAEALMQAGLEAIRNSLRHAQSFPPHVELSIERDGVGVQSLVLCISDQGPGFDPGAVPPERLGIADSIVRRMALASGEAHIVSAPGLGTTVTLLWKRAHDGS